MTYIYNNPIFSNINIPGVQFKSTKRTLTPLFESSQDSYNTNPLYDKFVQKEEIAALAKSNPTIMQMLKEYKLPLKINDKELAKLKQGHLMDTRVISAKIYSALPPELKEDVNIIDLQQAAMLHDYGKVLIPEKILNKKGQLSETEREIMQLHSDFGYELLKQQGINENILNMVKYHHQTPQGNGYPSLSNNFEYGISSQILAAADKYSALREQRPYKDAMSREEALNIIKEDVKTGLISEEVYQALEKSV